MRDNNRNCEEKRNLSRDLSRDTLYLRFISEFDKITLYDMRFKKKKIYELIILLYLVDKNKSFQTLKHF